MNCIFKEKNASKDLILLHGYNSNKKTMLSKINEYDYLDYNIIACDAYGHGESNGNMCDWLKSAEKIHQIINKRKNDTILIGNSLGGAEALYIALQNNFVKKVFAISTPHDNSFLNDSNLITKHNVKKCIDEFNQIEQILPKNQNDVNNDVEYYFIHSKNDSTVLIDDLYKNIEKYNVPNDRVLIYDLKTPGFLSHIVTYYKDKTHNFIKKNL